VTTAAAPAIAASSSSSSAAGAAPASARSSAPGRLDAVDWLRGFAVVLMIQTHLYDAWVSDPVKRVSVAYGWTRFWGGVPARLFLLLVGVSIAIRFESQIAKKADRSTMVRGVVKRGFEIFLLAYLFRLQEFTLSGFGGDLMNLFRIDILNCIGASMMAIAFIVAPIRGRPQIALALIAAAVVVGLGPIIGPMHFPDFIPRPISSYFGGERPMAWFPLFPWAAWPLVGVAIGHIWVRQARISKRREALVFILSGIVGMALIYGVTLVRKINPYIIHYPSDVVQQMGPGAFIYRLGMIGPMVTAGWLICRLLGDRFSVMRQFGRTSLLVYWIHVDLCSGLVSGRLHGRLNMVWATVGFVVMTGLMLAVSIYKTKSGGVWKRRLAALRSTRPSTPTAPTAPTSA
jgi:uncharacterized membrane protein